MKAAFEGHASGRGLEHNDLLALFGCFFDPTEGADSDECFGLWRDVNGDSVEDLVIKRYWTGSGNAFDLVVITRKQSGFSYYLFNGCERGITYDGSKQDLLFRQVVDLAKNGKCEIIIPECLHDMGAYTVANWPTIYALKGDTFEVSDAMFPDFYRRELLPKLKMTLEDGEPNQDQEKDLQEVRALVASLGRAKP